MKGEESGGGREDRSRQKGRFVQETKVGVCKQAGRFNVVCCRRVYVTGGVNIE